MTGICSDVVATGPRTLSRNQIWTIECKVSEPLVCIIASQQNTLTFVNVNRFNLTQLISKIFHIGIPFFPQGTMNLYAGLLGQIHKKI